MPDFEQRALLQRDNRTLQPMGEINWPITMMVHFVAGERDTPPLPELTDLVIGSDENGKYLYAWPADRTKTMQDLKAGDVLVFKITSSYVID